MLHGIAALSNTGPHASLLLKEIAGSYPFHPPGGPGYGKRPNDTGFTQNMPNDAGFTNKKICRVCTDLFSLSLTMKASEH